MANKGQQSTIEDHSLSSLVILSIKNENVLYINCQFTTEDSAALKAQRPEFGCQ